jgi:hypothetical protein
MRGKLARAEALMKAQKHVWIAIPAYTGTIHLSTMRSIISDMLKLAERGDRVTIFDESGNAMIGDCRGLICTQFLASDATHLVFVDSDVSWSEGSLLKLVDHDLEFVAGLYPQRRDPIDFCCQWAPGESLDTEQLIEVLGVPAGFMCLSRAMLEKMVAHYPDTQFHCEAAPDKTAYDLFGAYRVGRIKFGEDYSFCRRWRDIGGKVWIDPTIRMGHCGYKTFVSSVGEWLEARGKDDNR